MFVCLWLCEVVLIAGATDGEFDDYTFGFVFHTQANDNNQKYMRMINIPAGWIMLDNQSTISVLTN